MSVDPNIAGKEDIRAACAILGLTGSSVGQPGDDCAVIPDGNGHLLFATEGFINGFVEADPWFAGWCGVMVNLSDILAMGGRPTAITNAIWAPDAESARPVLEGMRAASEAYGIPIVGGHTNLRTAQRQLAVSIIGRTKAIISSFTARPDDTLVAAIDHRGTYRAPFDNWQAALSAPHARLRGDMEILPLLAEDGLVHAGKDISQGGIPGTALMLAECSGVGMVLDVDAIPLPDGVDATRWLRTFPSFGFLLATRQPQAVIARFAAREITAAAIGQVTAGSEVTLHRGGVATRLRDHAQHPYLGLTQEHADA